MTFTPEQVSRSLSQMRVDCVHALASAAEYSGALAPLSVQATVRAHLFAQAAADLSGASVDEELDRAGGVVSPVWRMPAPSSESADTRVVLANG